jgi:hypothetical protein
MPMCVADREGWNGPECQKDANSVGRVIALGCFFSHNKRASFRRVMLIMSLLKLWYSSSTKRV